MTRFLLVSTLLLHGASPAAAQTEGRVSVGGSIVFAKPTDSEVNSVFGGGLLVRLNPKKGWGPTAAFNWFTADIDNPSGRTDSFARLRVRPLMAGIAYTAGNQPVLVSFSAAAGPSFNKLSLEDDFIRTLPAGANPEVDAKTSVAVRPGVGLTYTVAPRVAIVGFGGFVFNRPDVVYRDASGQEFRNRWKADAAVLSVGAVYSLF
jgi:hypothetical protein